MVAGLGRVAGLGTVSAILWGGGGGPGLIGGRWTNPLMGWASSADYVQGTTMKFRTREEAVAFVSCQVLE